MDIAVSVRIQFFEGYINLTFFKSKWSDISLDLIIVRTGLIPGSANFTELTLVRHRLAVNGNFNGEDVVEFDVPTDRNFKFFRVWDL